MPGLEKLYSPEPEPNYSPDPPPPAHLPRARDSPPFSLLPCRLLLTCRGVGWGGAQHGHSGKKQPQREHKAVLLLRGGPLGRSGPLHCPAQAPGQSPRHSHYLCQHSAHSVPQGGAGCRAQGGGLPRGGLPPDTLLPPRLTGRVPLPPADCRSELRPRPTPPRGPPQRAEDVESSPSSALLPRSTAGGGSGAAEVIGVPPTQCAPCPHKDSGEAGRGARAETAHHASKPDAHPTTEAGPEPPTTDTSSSASVTCTPRAGRS